MDDFASSPVPLIQGVLISDHDMSSLMIQDYNDDTIYYDIDHEIFLGFKHN